MFTEQDAKGDGNREKELHRDPHAHAYVYSFMAVHYNLVDLQQLLSKWLKYMIF